MNTLTPNPKSFKTRAYDYERYRPKYEELIKYLCEQQLLNLNDVVADIGAGTGQISEELLKNGNIVHALEPEKEMFDSLNNKLSKFKVDGQLNTHFTTAEDTKLPDNSIDLIVCAQSFHFFNKDLTKIEFSRILKKNGRIILLWNTIDYIEHPRLKEILMDYVDPSGISNLCEPNFMKKQKLEQFFSPKIVRTLNATNTIHLDLDALIGLVFSFSYMPKRTAQTAHLLMEDLTKYYNSHGRQLKLILNMQIFTTI